jgi:hypothetical protein
VFDFIEEAFDQMAFLVNVTIDLAPLLAVPARRDHSLLISVEKLPGIRGKQR